ncbi:MAG TPA: phosphoenolpyruvate--protein phosphotransferase [Holosporales bacterium]|nr:phosphoenolpyruvate--protein phosphotransferase [Holosporales bacterium]
MAQNRKLKSKKKLPRSEGVTLLRRVREVMAGEATDPQERLDKISFILLGELKADACSIYMVRPGNILELAATSGLNKVAVGVTRLTVGEGVVGHVVSEKRPISLSCIAQHPKFILRPETGEQHIQGGVAAVPLLRDNEVLGALSIQATRKKRFSADTLEVLEIVSMLITDLVLSLTKQDSEGIERDIPTSKILQGIPLNIGLAEGTAVIHAQKVDIPLVMSDNSQEEQERFEKALLSMNKALETLFDETQQQDANSKDQQSILETFQMFAKDQGWLSKIRKAIIGGYTAEAAAQKALNDIRSRLYASNDFYMRERLWDFEDLTYRLIQHLQGKSSKEHLKNLNGIVVVAKSLGPAELLEYQKYNVRAVLLEEGVQTAHVAILARSLDIPIIGRIPDVTTRIFTQDTILVDGKAGTAIVRPNSLDEQDFWDQKAKQEIIQKAANAVLPFPPITVDGVRISLNLNAGLIGDLDQLQETGADGVGLYRTEIPFMMQKEFPDVTYQNNLYSELYTRVQDKPLVFRTLDIGGDKVLPYFNRLNEENPMLGWRAIRIGLDRPMLLRKQVRAMIGAAKGNQLHIMFPMISAVSEFLEAKSLVQKELAREETLGHLTPLEVKYGAMIEVPSLVWRLDQLLPHTDFISIGTNDLFQFFFAVDRGNPYVAQHFDTLSPAFLSLLKEIKTKADKHRCPLSICGEMASRPLEALALLGLGYRSLSMGAAAIGASKMMIRTANIRLVEDFLSTLLPLNTPSVRNALISFAKDNQIKI